MPNSLAELLTATAGAHAERPALKLDDMVVNYAALNEGATRVAGLLKEKGVAPGDRVGIMLPNVPYFGVIYYGILRAGGVAVPMNPLLKGREVKFYIEDAGTKLLFAWGGFEEAAEQGADEGVIGMRHLVRAVALEYGKQGRLTLEADFEHFHELIRTPGGTPRNGAG